MSSLPLLKQTVLDANGDPVSGALVHFYEAGTTTPLDTFSDPELTAPNANPVVADGNGRIGPIYLQTDELYKVRYEDAATSLLYEVDNVSAVQLTRDSLLTRLRQVASNPLDYGAVGDGVSDESAAVQSAIDNATGVVDLLGKTYRCDSAISLKSNVRITNGELNFSNGFGDLLAQGNQGLSFLLASNALKGAKALNVSNASGFSSGDLVFIESSEARNNGLDIGEMNRVRSISGNTLNLERPLLADYNTIDAARVVALEALENVVIDRLRIVASTSGDQVIDARHVRNLSIRDVSMDLASSFGIALRRVYGAEISSVSCEQHTGSGSHGLMIDEASRMVDVDGYRGGEDQKVIVGGQFSGVQDGVVSDVTLRGIRVGDVTSGAGIEIADMADRVTVIDSVCDSILVAGTNVSLVRCETDAISIAPTVFGSAVENSYRVLDCVAQSLSVVNGGAGTFGQPIKRLEIRGMRSEDAPADSISITGDATNRFETIVIDGCVLENPAARGIEIEAGSNVNLYDALRVTGNYVFSAAGESIYVDIEDGDSDNVTIISNNMVADSVLNAIYGEIRGRLTCSGNVCDVTNTGVDVIEFAPSSGSDLLGTVTGNSTTAGTNGIQVATGNPPLAVVGNCTKGYLAAGVSNGVAATVASNET